MIKNSLKIRNLKLKISGRQRFLLQIALGILVVIALPLVIISLRKPPASQAAWFSDDWLYRKAVNITNSSGSNLTDYQVSFTVDTTDSARFQTDCDDIRITDISGKLIPYWIEEGSAPCNNAATRIWTKVPSLPTSGATLYVYYGNPSAASYQNGGNTFIFFDDFNGGSLNTNLWSATGTVSVSGGVMTLGSANEAIASTTNFGTDVALRTRSNFTAGDASDWIGFIVGGSSPLAIFQLQSTANPSACGGNGTFNARNYVGSDTCTVITGATGAYKVFDLTRISSTKNEYFMDGVSKATHTSNVSTSSLPLTFYVSNQSNTIASDWALIRKVVSTEPTTSAGSEEKSQGGPVAYWKFDDGYGQIASDSAALNEYGTLGANSSVSTIDDPTWIPEEMCVTGKCLKFDGNNNFVNATNTSIKFGPSDSFTFSAWFNKKVDKGNNSVFVQQGTTNKFGYGLTGAVDGTFYAYVGKNGVGTNPATSSVLSLSTWYHAVGVFDGSTIKLYINGVLVATTAYTYGAISAADSSAYIGDDSDAPTTRAFKGFIDDVKVYNYARTAAQIQADYNAGLSGEGTVEGTSTSFGAKSNKWLSNGLVGYWKMDEASWNGTFGEVIDSSGNSRHGTRAGDGTTTAGKFGNGGTFDGTGDYVSINHNSVFNTTNALTIATWVKTSDGSNNYITTKGEDSWYLAIGPTGQTANKLNFYLNGINSPSWLEGTASLNDNAWHLVVATYDGKTRTLYVDGKVDGSDSKTGSISTGSSSVLLGERDTGVGTDNYNGVMDEVRIYNRALTPSEVEGLYNFAPGPIGYWDLEETSGTIYDKSGNGNDSATITGTSIVPGKYGKARHFTETSHEMIDNINITEVPLKSYTLQGWVKKDSNPATGKSIFTVVGTNDAADTANTAILALGYESDKFILHRGNWGTNGKVWGCNASSCSIPLNTWTHIAATQGAGSTTVNFYLNGVLASSDSAPTTWGAGTYPEVSGSTYISSTGENWAMDGAIDNPMIHNYVRTTKQIIEDMNAGHPAGGSPVGSALGHWKFDNGYGDIASNSGLLGTAADGNLAGTNNTCPGAATCPSWTNDGKFDKALSFDGVNDFISMPNESNFDFINMQFTVSGWFKTTNSTAADRMIVAKGGTASNWQWRVNLANDHRLLAGIFEPDSGTIYSKKSASTVNDGLWHYFAAVMDTNSSSENVTLYLDGVEQRTVGSDGRSLYNYSNGSNPLLIGARGTDASNQLYFPGAIDETKIYNYALTTDEIKLDMNQGKSVVLGSMSDTSGLSGGQMASNSASAEYCVPGDSTSCNSPVAEWKFDERSGSVVYDKSGNGINGDLINTPTWTSGKFGGGLMFNGSSSYVRVNNHALLNPSQLTISVWAKSNTATWNDYGFLVSKRDAYIIHPNIGSTLVGFYIANPGWTSVGCTPVDITQWNYYTLTWDGTNLRCYINGVLGNSSTPGGSINTADTGELNIGKDDGLSRYFNGKIDEVKIYNYARSPAQIAWDYNRGGPVGHWKLDECQGATVNDAIGTASATLTVGATGSQTVIGTCTTPTDGTGAWYNGRNGKFGSSLNFDGTNDYVNIPDGSNNIFDPTSEYSLSAWVKYTSTTSYGFIISKAYDGTAGGYELFRNSGTGVIRFASCDLTGTCSGGYFDIQTTASYNDGNWHHVVATAKTNSTAKIYIDGVLVKESATITQDNIRNAQPVSVGRRGDNSLFFNGQIDDVRIYNYALNVAQIKNVMNEGMAVRWGPSTGSP